MRRVLVVAIVLVAALLVYLLSADDRERNETQRAGHRADEPRDAPPADESDATSTTVSPPVPTLESRRAGVDLDRDVHGIVVEKNGPPIAGAEVAAVSYPWRRTALLNLAGYDEVDPGPTTRTAADGWFKLPLERGRQVALRVRAEGYAPVEVRPYLAGEYVKVELTRGARLLVRAFDDRKNPLAGVTLRLFPRARTGPWWFEKKGVTDAEGRFTFTGVPIGATAWLEPKHETWGHPSWGWLEVKFPDGSDVVKEFAMRPGRTVTGTVTDKETGRPIEGARVGAGWTMRQATTTDNDGRYELRGWVGEGVREIHAHAKGYGPDNVVVGSKEVVDFALAPGTAVKARVVDVTGRPLAGVMVGVIASVHDGNKQTISDGYALTGEDGRFEIGSLRAEMKHRLVLLKRGYGRTLREFDPVPAAKAPLDLGDVAMPAALSIEGRVLDADGMPVPRTAIELVTETEVRAGGSYGRSEDRVTDHLGRFRFPDLAPGKYTLHVRRAGAAAVERKVELVDADRLDVEIRLADGRDFVVTVVDDAGAPVEGAFVVLQHEQGRVQGRTDAEGRVVLQVTGRVLRIEPPWGPSTDRKYLRGEPRTDLPAGQSEAKFVLERAAQVTGKVVDPDGKPVAGAVLDSRRGDEQFGSTSTNGAGEFTLTVPRDGTTDIVLTAVRREVAQGTYYDSDMPWRGELKGVSPGSEGLVMRLIAIPADRALVVRVVDPGGKPVAGVSVLLAPWPSNRQPTRAPATDRDGVVRFDGLVARETRVSVRLPSDSTFAIPPPETVMPNGQTVEIALRRAVTLAGTVVNGDGKPVARAFLMLFDGDTMLASGSTAANGRFALRVPADLGHPMKLRYGVPSERRWGDRDNVDPATGELTLVLEEKR